MESPTAILENGQDDGETTTRWEGYANYKAISWTMAQDVNRAIKAGAKIDRHHREDAPIQPEVAAEAGARLLTPMLNFIPEMRRDQDEVELYQEVLGKWTEEYNGGEPIIRRLAEAKFTESTYSWLTEYLLDLRNVAWELGYMRSGRWSREMDDPVEEESRQMFQGG